jgi:hypothetical protein
VDLIRRNQNTPTHIGHRVFILTVVQTCLNPLVPCIPLFFASVSTPTFKFDHKTKTIGTHHGAHEIKICESNGVSIYNQVSSRLIVVSRISPVYN